MTFIRISSESPVPVYQQIVEQIQNLTGSQQLKPGIRLPTVRQLASDLGIAVNTAARAYQTLEREGIIETRGRHGTIVAARGHPRYSGAECRRRLSESIDQALVTGYHLGLSRDEIRTVFEERLEAFRL